MLRIKCHWNNHIRTLPSSLILTSLFTVVDFHLSLPCLSKGPLRLTHFPTRQPAHSRTAIRFFARTKICGTCLVAKWLRMHLPMQGTRVRALVWEDPPCRGATKPRRHNYWVHVPQLLKPMRLEPVLRNKRSHHGEKPCTLTKSSPCSPQLEKARAQQQRPNTAKN